MYKDVFTATRHPVAGTVRTRDVEEISPSCGGAFDC